ncbi:MAG TPA: porin, partial [Bacteroidales bacterium]|nr:porin [Bacteroidales bacterium]
MLKHYFKVAVFGIVLGMCITNVRAQSDSIRKDQYGLIVNRIPMVSESRNGVLVFESKDQSIKTWFDLRVNFDGAHYFDKNALNELGSGATIRRLRFAMKTILYKTWTGEVDLDFAGGVLEVKDAFIGFKPGDKFYVKAGYFKEPISMETTTTSRYQTFIEEPYMTMFAPQRQIGINVSNWNKFYLAALGIHFNDVENMEVVTYSQNANKDFGTDEGYSFTGKLALRPIHTDKFLVHIAGSGSYRTPKTSSEFANAVRFSTRDMTNINRKKFLDSDD